MACKYNCNRGRVFMEGQNTFVPCPDCSNIEKLVEKSEVTEGVSLFDRLKIPVMYKSLGSAGEELFKSQQVLNSFSTSSISEVERLLERLNNDFYNKRVPMISAYVYVPNLVDIKHFVYGAQKIALEKGLGVTPYVSANTLYGLQRVGDFPVASLKEISVQQGGVKDIPPDLMHAVDGYRIVQDTDCTYFDFTHADVCFIDATANTTERGWTAVADLLHERAKNSLPTFVMGYWSTRASDSSGNRGLKYLLAPETGINRLDLLIPFELKSKSSGGNYSTPRHFDPETTQSSVLSGVNIDTLMG